MSDQHTAASDLPLVDAVTAADPTACLKWLETADGAEITLRVSRLTDDQRAELLAMLPPEQAAFVLQHLPESQTIEAIEDLEPSAAAAVLEALPSDEQADVLSELEDEDVSAILGEFSNEEDARAIKSLAEYPWDSAGGLMVTEHLRFDQSLTIGSVIDDLSEHADKYADYDIQYAYVTDSLGRLRGVLRLRDLLLTRRETPLVDIMTSPISVRTDTTLDELDSFFEDHRFFGAPVIDQGEMLVGVVLRSAVEAALTEDSERTYRKSQGIVGGEELRTMPLTLRSRRRLSWLSINIVLNLLAASVIAMHQDTLQAVIALAVFLPIISDMSGCSGNQAVAVSMRELSLGVTRPKEILRVLRAEALVGIINGLALGVLIGILAYLWKGMPALGLVVGSALMLNTVIAVCIGGGVPLLLKRLGFDPALASGPILTTVTDMCGFFLVLTFASAMLSSLTPAA